MTSEALRSLASSMARSTAAAPSGDLTYPTTIFMAARLLLGGADVHLMIPNPVGPRAGGHRSESSAEGGVRHGIPRDRVTASETAFPLVVRSLLPARWCETRRNPQKPAVARPRARRTMDRRTMDRRTTDRCAMDRGKRAELGPTPQSPAGRVGAPDH